MVLVKDERVLMFAFSHTSGLHQTRYLEHNVISVPEMLDIRCPLGFWNKTAAVGARPKEYGEVYILCFAAVL